MLELAVSRKCGERPRPSNEYGKTVSKSKKQLNGFHPELDNRVTSKERVTIDVGGSRFVLLKSRVEKYPETRLARLIGEDQTADSSYFFFDRNPDMFNSVLDLYRKGVIHVPSYFCGNGFKEELTFWGISDVHIADCCIGKIVADLANLKATKDIQKELLSDFEHYCQMMDNSQGFARTKLNIWLFLEFPIYSKAAKVWSLFFSALIVASIVALSLETHPSLFIHINTTGRLQNGTNGTVYDELKWTRLWETDENAALWISDVVLNVIFSIEIIVKISFAPRLMNYFASKLNIVDVLTVSSFWVGFTILETTVHLQRQQDFRLQITYMFFMCIQMLRILRVFKLAHCFLGLRVLLMVLRHSLNELATVVVFLVVGMFVFSFLIFFAELTVQDSFESIPRAFWWSIITMTTVGYGDKVPKGNWGFVVGATCAIGGMLLTGLSIPIISNNFNLYYRCINFYIRGEKAKETFPTNCRGYSMHKKY